MTSHDSLAGPMRSSLVGRQTKTCGRQDTGMTRNIALGLAPTEEDSLDKQIVKTKLWTLREIGHGDTLEEKDQEALDNCFDMRQGKAEAMRENINREEMMSL